MRPRIVCLPIQLAAMPLLPLAQAWEFPLYSVLEALTTLHGGITLLRRDQPPLRWQTSPFALPQTIREQHHQWASSAQTPFLLWPSLIVTDEGTPMLNCRWVNTTTDTTELLLSLPLAEQTDLEAIHTIAGTVFTALAAQTNTSLSPTFSLTSVVPDVTLLQPDTPAEAWLHAWQQHPTYPWVAFQAGQLAQRQGTTAQAISAFQAALYRSQASEFSNAAFQATCWQSLASLWAQQQAWPQAEQAYSEAIRLESIAIDSYLALGHLQESQHRLPEAIATLQQGLAQQPLEIRLHVSLARIHSKLAHWPDAIAHYAAQHRLNPHDPWAVSNMAMGYLQLNQPDEARRYLTETIALDPDGDAGATAQIILMQL